MSNSDPPEYKGNSIFRNQPNHSYFDKPFEDEQDFLYQVLHEIDPHFLKPKQQAESINLATITVKDPRTKEPIRQLYYDYTKEEDTKLFTSPKKSIMTEKQHEDGVRILNLLQQGLEVGGEDMYNWYRLKTFRLREAQYFQQFVFEFFQNIKEQIYAPCRKLLDVYQKWYRSKAFRLMKRYPQEMYNTHLGLPQVRQCKNALSELQVKLINQEIVSTVGEKCWWHGHEKEDFKKFGYSIESYARVYESSEDLKESLEDNLQLQFIKLAEQELRESPYFYIPLESLLFLLTAGDYTDTPTEMLLNIKETENLESDFNKYISMDIPLPSRQCGWHTYDQIVEQAAVSMLSIKHTKSFKKEKIESEVAANNLTAFKVLTFEDFMERSTQTADKLCKFSKTLTKWQLATLENDEHIQLYTSLDDFIENKSVAIKLEYKPQFGCEILTKYEILREWLKLKLTGASNSTCLRLDVTNYHTLLEELITVNKLEECLYSVYRIRCSEMLNNLFEFLKMLYNMPAGQYMLRYNSKFKDKLLLCKPSKEITQNTINLHKLLDADVTDKEFMSQPNFLAIDENLCSLMHMQHKILPAAFSPHAFNRKIFAKKQTFMPRTKNKLAPHKKGAQQGEQDYKKPIMNNSQKKRMRRKQREYEAAKVNNDLKELEHDMELDRKMMIF